VLFAADSFAGAFIVQSFLAYYYHGKYNLSFYTIGTYLFVCNILSGMSEILAEKLVYKIGVMETMIYTRLPSNVFLICIGLTDNVYISTFLLICCFCVSQMDVPAKKMLVTLVVSPEELSAANSIINIAKSLGLAIGLGVNGFCMLIDPRVIWFSVPFILAGGIKLICDIIIGSLFLWNQNKQK
jgi:predicted MFS family arabinose efflux permease